MNVFDEMLKILKADRSIESILVIADQLEEYGYLKESTRMRINRANQTLSDEYFLTRAEGWLRILAEDWSEDARD